MLSPVPAQMPSEYRTSYDELAVFKPGAMHPVTTATIKAQPINQSAECLLRRWAFDVRRWTFKSFYKRFARDPNDA
jgi:hypothetical protein